MHKDNLEELSSLVNTSSLALRQATEKLFVVLTDEVAHAGDKGSWVDVELAERVRSRVLSLTSAVSDLASNLIVKKQTMGAAARFRRPTAAETCKRLEESQLVPGALVGEPLKLCQGWLRVSKYRALRVDQIVGMEVKGSELVITMQGNPDAAEFVECGGPLLAQKAFEFWINTKELAGDSVFAIPQYALE